MTCPASAPGGKFEKKVDFETSDPQREREKVLWDAYMAQASTPQEKRQLLAKTQADYKLTVVDPDYFVRPAQP